MNQHIHAYTTITQPRTCRIRAARCACGRPCLSIAVHVPCIISYTPATHHCTLCLHIQQLIGRAASKRSVMIPIAMRPLHWTVSRLHRLLQRTVASTQCMSIATFRVSAVGPAGVYWTDVSCNDCVMLSIACMVDCSIEIIWMPWATLITS